MQRNDVKFHVLSLSSDLRMVGMATIHNDQNQATVFFKHAHTLLRSIPLHIHALDSLTASIPSNQIDRLKKADKFLTWSNITQELELPEERTTIDK